MRRVHMPVRSGWRDTANNSGRGTHSENPQDRWARHLSGTYPHDQPLDDRAVERLGLDSRCRGAVL